MDTATREEILRRYERHARRFERHAESRRRRGLALAAPLDVAPPPPAYDRLSPLELSILQLIAEGLTDREIASRRGLSQFTVKSHVRNLFQKLPAKNRPHAVAVAVKTGLLNLHAA